jgi:hypothetical protein
VVTVVADERRRFAEFTGAGRDQFSVGAVQRRGALQRLALAANALLDTALAVRVQATTAHN